MISESSAVGSARAWGARGRRFDSCLSDNKKDPAIYGGIFCSNYLNRVEGFTGCYYNLMYVN
jgi:hypothetical protein